VGARRDVKFGNGLIIASASPQMTKHRWKGHIEVMWTIKIFVGTNHISATAAASVVKFCTQVGYIKSQHMDDKSPLKGTLSGSHNPF